MMDSAADDVVLDETMSKGSPGMWTFVCQREVIARYVEDSDYRILDGGHESLAIWDLANSADSPVGGCFIMHAAILQQRCDRPFSAWRCAIQLGGVYEAVED